jgi:hypothetical protein
MSEFAVISPEAGSSSVKQLTLNDLITDPGNICLCDLYGRVIFETKAVKFTLICRRLKIEGIDIKSNKVCVVWSVKWKNYIQDCKMHISTKSIVTPTITIMIN